MDGAIGIDWGTSNLRATLFDADGSVREQRDRPWGVRNLPAGGFDLALAEVCAGWPVWPVLASGMVGSREGWREVEYVETPADIDMLVQGTIALRASGGRRVCIVPGVRCAEGPDVMRGEETQVMGALSLCPQLAVDSQILLPGTHSKWVDVRAGKIVRFATMMTGELYALLCRHSILGAVSPHLPAGTNPQAFDEGVRTARACGNAGVLTRIFSARTLVLASHLQSEAVPDYLSGLLIGEEWRATLASGWLHAGHAPTMVGDDRQCALYQRAASTFDLPPPPAVSGAAASGLWRIHMALEKTSHDAASTPAREHC